MSKMMEFLSSVSLDPEVKSQFAQNPQAVLDAFGLNAEEQMVIKIGNHEEIALMVGRDDERKVPVHKADKQTTNDVFELP